MVPHADKLRDIAAKPTLQNICRDRKRVSKVLKPVLKTIKEYLFDGQLDVNFLWKKSKVSRWRSDQFTKEVGTTPADYIARHRLTIGAELLKNTSLLGFQIAFAIGYGDVYDTFANAFKKRFGLSPLQYRAQFSEKGNAGTWGIECASGAPAKGIEDEPRTELGDVGKQMHVGESQHASINRNVFETGLHYHAKGAQAILDGDVDVAYEDLGFADQCYARAGELSTENLRRKRAVPGSHMTDEAFLSALCPTCRTSLVSSVGSTVRGHLGQALRFVPRDLHWFKDCCNTCYRTTWDALRRARLGLMDDAWKAWWLSTHVDPEERETPPSVGRVIATLVEVERLVSGDQLERKAYAEFAVEDAAALGKPLLEAQARLWLAAVLGAMSQIDEAQKILGQLKETCHNSPWLSALRFRVEGLLESYRSHHSRALRLFRSSAELYEGLDTHLNGYLLVQQGNVLFDLSDFSQSIAINQKARAILDHRRDPFPGFGVVPIHLANSYAALGQGHEAKVELSKCSFDRDVHRVWASTEILSCACLDLLHRRPKAALDQFLVAGDRFDRLNIPRSAALAATYSIEAYVLLGNRVRALESAVSAMSFFEASGCTQDMLEAFAKIRSLLEQENWDVTAVETAVRRVTQQHGGWLPVPENRPSL